MFKLSSYAVADLLHSRACTFFRMVSFGRLTIIWDTEKPVPDRAPGAVG